MSVLIKALEKAQAEKAQAKKSKQTTTTQAEQKSVKSPKKRIGTVTATTNVDDIPFEALTLSPPESSLQSQETAPALSTSPTPLPDVSVTPDVAEPTEAPVESISDFSEPPPVGRPVEKVAVQRPNSKVGVERRAPQSNQAEAANVFTAKRIDATNQNTKLAIVAGAALIALLAIGVYFYRVLHDVTEPLPMPRPAREIQQQPAPPTSLPAPSQPQADSAPATPPAAMQDELPSKKSVEKSTLEATKPPKTERPVMAADRPSRDQLLSESDAIEEQAPAGSKKGAISRTVNVEKAIASESASIQVTRSKPQAGVNPVLMRAYEAYTAGNDEEAQKLYKQVLLYDRLNVDAMLGLGAIATRQERLADAKAWYRKVLELDPRNGVAQAALLDSQQQESPQASMTQIKSMLAKAPTDPSLHTALANLYAAQNQWVDAQQSYFEAYRLHPSAESAYNLAVSLDQMGKPKLALPYYQEALHLLPSGTSSIDRAALEARIAAIQ